MRKLTLTLASLLVAAPLAAAPGGPGRGAPGFGTGEPGARFEHRAERIAELLQLDDAQRAAFDQLRDQGKAAAQPKLQAMRTLHQELRALIDAGSTDARAIGEKTLELHRLRAELRAEREAAKAEFVELLSDEQRFAFEAFEQAREERRGGRGRHHGPGFGPGGPQPELD